MMRHGSLFSGIGGFDLAAERMGWQNVFHCEKDKFCNKILKHYWSEADSYEDIKNFDGGKYNGHIDVISGGFPCQPFSVAGQRRGKADDRYLFPEALRVIKAIRPRWIVLENVAGIFTVLEPDSLSEMEHKAVELFCADGNEQINSTIVSIRKRVLGTIVDEIRAAGYVLPQLADGTPIVLCIPACAVGAVHRRDRVWIVAHSGSIGRSSQLRTRPTAQERGKVSGTFGTRAVSTLRQTGAVESPFCCADDVFPEGLDGAPFSKWRKQSIRAYGNAIVPQVAYELFKVIDAVENGNLVL